MDLGIRGKRALICASSKGLGRGCAEALAEAGADLVLNARGGAALEAAAAEIAARHGVRVTPVAADITTEASIFWSRMRADRRRVCGRTGRARISSGRLMPTC
jgi:short-subunit dehydrogenase